MSHSQVGKAVNQSESSVNADMYVSYVKNQKATSHDPENLFLTADEKMIKIREVIRQVAATSAPILITGESGTGKEVIAKAIHKASERSSKPFFAINCAAIPVNLLESELFGYEKGSFTGAHQRHIGKFEQANHSTLLLDEVTEIDSSLQVKLLRVLQEQEIERIGGHGPIPVTPRIVATSNRNIVELINLGKFRQDLFFRLNVIHIEIPPLRQRQQDIALLSRYFIAKYSRLLSKPIPSITENSWKKILSYDWPGNVRELENAIQRATIMCREEITENDIVTAENGVSYAKEWSLSLPIGRPLRDVETQFILKTLEHFDGNRTHAAKCLGISLRTLRNKINEYTTSGIKVIGPAHGRHA